MFTIEFILTSLVVVLLPGTGVLYTINTGLVQKTRYAIAAAIGCTLGIIPHLLASIVGLSAIMNMSAKVFTVIKMMGSAYLLYLAWKTWTGAGKTVLSDKQAKGSFLDTIVKGIVINVLNPKLTLFFLSFLPQFVPATNGTYVNSMILLSFMFMAMTLLVFIGYGVLASLISDLVLMKKNIMKSIERGFALVFAGLAVKLAFEDK